MSTIQIILTVIDVIVAVVNVVLFLVQEGNDNGMGIVGGASTDSYYSKSKGRSKEEQLKRGSMFTAIIFGVVTVLLYLAVSRHW